MKGVDVGYGNKMTTENTINRPCVFGEMWQSEIFGKMYMLTLSCADIVDALSKNKFLEQTFITNIEHFFFVIFTPSQAFQLL